MVPFVRMAATILAAGTLLACSSKPQAPAAEKPPAARAVTQYELRGVVVAVDSGKRELRIKHEDIPGYMRAMTMDFPVRDQAALQGVAAGDAITAKLNVAGPGDYWLSDIRKTAAKSGQ